MASRSITKMSIIWGLGQKKDLNSDFLQEMHFAHLTPKMAPKTPPQTKIFDGNKVFRP